MLIFVKFNFLNRFFILNGLWIPNSHPLNFFKLFFYLFQNDLVIKELNIDLKTWGCKDRLGSSISNKSIVLSYMLLIIEFALSIKYNMNNDHFYLENINLKVISIWLIFYLICFIYWIKLRFFCKTN
jgi:hypothetical protein